MTTGVLRVACLGAGYFSQFHYGSWRRIESVDLLASCDTDITKARGTGLRAYNDLDEMLATEAPDLLDIILPPLAHAEAIRKALATGVRWLVCQKPFCRSLDEARAMTDLADAHDATIVVHENFRFQPWYRVIKNAIDKGAVGGVHQVTFRLRPGDGQGPEAYLDRQPYFQGMEKFLVHETAVHWIDTFRFLLGNPISVYADLRHMNPHIAGEDAGYVIFDHGSGVRALFDGNRHLDHVSDNLRRTMGEAMVEGTEGTLYLRGDGSVALRRFGDASEEILSPPNTGDGFGGDCVHALQTHVANGFLGQGPLENTAREYLDVVRIEEAIYTSASSGQRVDLCGESDG